MQANLRLRQIDQLLENEVCRPGVDQNWLESLFAEKQRLMECLGLKPGDRLESF